jgi:hypothetical protein
MKAGKIRLEILTADSSRLSKSRSLPNARIVQLSSIPEEEAIHRFTDRMAEKYESELKRRSFMMKRTSNRPRRNFDVVSPMDTRADEGKEVNGFANADIYFAVHSASKQTLKAKEIALDNDFDLEVQEDEDVPESPVKLCNTLPFESK